jgi:hypothetical protein
MNSLDELVSVMGKETPSNILVTFDCLVKSLDENDTV